MSLTRMEQQLIERLQCEFKPVQVDSLPALDTDDLLTLFGSKAPAMYVTPAPLTVKQGEVVVRWEVLLVTSLASNQRNARQGAVQTVGAYDLGWKLIAVCSEGIKLDKAILYMPGLDYLGGDAGMKLAKQGVLVASALLQGVCEAPSTFELDDFADLDTVRVNYDIPPMASAEDHAQLLNDETVPGLPDAQDDVKLGSEQ